ncbi:MAG: alpha/beta hydrolase [Pirellulaceae bacterium]
MNTHYFGSSQQPLLGIHHPPRLGTSRDHAVLICAPIAHEHLRTHWALRLLAQRLAREGFDVMRFDYTGIGDSYASTEEVDSLHRWVDDVQLATDDLLAESGCSRLSMIGLRFGTVLAMLAARDPLSVDHLILWEPVLDGEDYLRQLRHMHDRMIDLWVCPVTTQDDDLGEEILGFTYPRALLNEIAAIDTVKLSPDCNRLTIIDGQGESPTDVAKRLTNAKRSFSCPTSVVEAIDRSDWDDLRQIETAWLPAHSQTVVINAAKESISALAQTSLAGVTT